MKTLEVKDKLKQLEKITFVLPNGGLVPPHFHITEAGLITKNFVDCGGTIRKEEVANFQLWNANDFDHRLEPQKLIDIIEIAEKAMNIAELEVEVEYQSETIGKYGLEFDGTNFLLTPTQTDCLAKDKCGIPAEQEDAEEVETEASCCSPSTGCC
ncbi:MAG: DUF6428 family protein [Verrucomicrobia bacterium]|nr:hypothetical protein [Verrucomicrobiota bacterium]MDA0724345.1 DUF6428 family protein [Verrucomicrobiota bacterium]MDA1048802.1 DUF6428 family protein [Verrucomicrobiota bacterium]